MNHRIQALQQLAGVRLRATRTRLLVLEALAACDCAQADADTLFARFDAAGNGVSLASVYRATRELAQCGLLRREWGHAGRALYRLSAGTRVGQPLRVVDGAQRFALSVSDPAMYEQLLLWLGSQGLSGRPEGLVIQVDGMVRDAAPQVLAEPAQRGGPCPPVGGSGGDALAGPLRLAGGRRCRI